MTHLTPERLEALLDGSLPEPERRALVAHLSDGCARCEEILADGPDLDTLARLLEAESADPEPLDAATRAAGWAALEAEVEDTEMAASPRPSGRRWWPAGVGTVLALAAAVVLFVWFSGPEPSPEMGVKGPVVAVAPEVHLRVVAGHVGTERFDLDRRVVSGDRVDRGETLLFEIETDRRAARYLFAVDPRHPADAGRVNVLAPPDGQIPPLEPAGRHRVAWRDGWVAYDLDDAPPEVTLVGAASAVPLDPMDVVSGWLDGRPPPEVGYESIAVEVSP